MQLSTCAAPGPAGRVRYVSLARERESSRVSDVVLARQSDAFSHSIWGNHDVCARHDRMSGPVGTEQSENRVFGNGEVKAVEGDRGAVPLDQPVSLDPTPDGIRFFVYSVRMFDLALGGVGLFVHSASINGSDCGAVVCRCTCG